MLHAKKILLMIIFTLIAFDVLAACRNIEGTNSSYPSPGVTQHVVLPIPIKAISPMPFSLSEFRSFNLLEVSHNLSGRVSCDGPLTLMHKLEQPMQYSGVNQQIADAPIYKTGLEGVGVALYNSVYNIPFTNEGTGYSTGSGNMQYSNTINLSLNVWSLSGNSTHGILEAESLPAALIYATDSSSGVLDDNAALIARLTFSGQVIYNAPTCVIEDKEIFLGKYPLSSFTGNTTTEWIDASVTMNCDRAFSSSSNRVFSSTANGGSSGSTIGTVNRYITSIEAVNGFIDSRRGIMEIDSGGATGVAVQISRKKSEDTFSSLEWETRYNPAETTNTFVMPLYARYIKTGSSVTAGKANSKLLYTVEYK
jgi:type 1 fimbria pilin